VTFNVTAEDKVDAVRRWNALSQAEKAAEGWLNKVDELEVHDA